MKNQNYLALVLILTSPLMLVSSPSYCGQSDNEEKGSEEDGTKTAAILNETLSEGEDKGQNKVTAQPRICFLNAPEKHPYASLSFEMPLSMVDLDPLATKGFINQEIIKKNRAFPVMSMNEPWQKNLHITVAGFPNIPTINFLDPEISHQTNSLVEVYTTRANEMMEERPVCHLDSQMPFKVMHEFFAIPNEATRDLAHKMAQDSLQAFPGFTPTSWMKRLNKGLGFHVTLDISPKEHMISRGLKSTLLTSVLDKRKKIW